MPSPRMMSSDNDEAGKVTWCCWIRTVLASLGALVLLLTIGITEAQSAVMLPQLMKNDSFINVTSDEASWIASLGVVMAPVSALIVGPFIDAFGRKRGLQVFYINTGLGYAVIAGASKVLHIYIGRIICGFGAGFYVCYNVYLVEICTKKQREVFFAITAAIMSGGFLISNIMIIYLSWNTAALICSIVCFTFFLFQCFIPESPAWLFSTGQEEACVKSLKRLGRSKAGIDHELTNLKLSKNADKEGFECRVSQIRHELANLKLSRDLESLENATLRICRELDLLKLSYEVDPGNLEKIRLALVTLNLSPDADLEIIEGSQSLKNTPQLSNTIDSEYTRVRHEALQVSHDSEGFKNSIDKTHRDTSTDLESLEAHGKPDATELSHDSVRFEDSTDQTPIKIGTDTRNPNEQDPCTLKLSEDEENFQSSISEINIEINTDSKNSNLWDEPRIVELSQDVESFWNSISQIDIDINMDSKSPNKRDDSGTMEVSNDLESFEKVNQSHREISEDSGVPKIPNQPAHQKLSNHFDTPDHAKLASHLDTFETLTNQTDHVSGVDLESQKTEKVLDTHKLDHNMESFDGAIRQIHCDLDALAQSYSVCAKRLKISTFLAPTVWKPFLIIVTLFFLQSASGIYAIIYYSVDFFDRLGTGYDPLLGSNIVSVVRFGTGATIATIFRTKVGRKSSIMFSAALMTLSLVGVGLYEYAQRDVSVAQRPHHWIPVSCLVVYLASVVLGMLSLPWLMSGEVFPLRVRGTAAGATNALGYTFMFISTKVYYVWVEALQIWGILFCFAGVTFVTIFFGAFILPETKGKSLYEIEEAFLPKKERRSNRVAELQTKVSKEAP